MPNVFVDLVRAARTPQPTQRSFSLEQWKSVFQGSHDASKPANRLYEAGVWAYRHLRSIREDLVGLGQLTTPVTRSVRLMVGLLNQAAVESSTRAISRVEQQGRLTHDVWDPMEGELETLMAGARYAISDAISATACSATPKQDEKQVIASVVRRLHLGMAYDTIEYLWGKCLWNYWYVEEAAGSNIVRPDNLEEEALRSIGLFRRDGLAFELIMYAHQLWPQEDERFRQAVRSRPRVVGIRRKGKRKELVVGPAGGGDASFLPEDISRLLAENLYLSSTLQEPLPQLTGLTANQILDAWRALSPLGSVVAEHFPVGDLLPKFGRIEEFAPIFDVEALSKAVRDGVHVTMEQARTIIELFTFSGTAREELWFPAPYPVRLPADYDSRGCLERAQPIAIY
jgi:hypothetical protein